MVIIQVKKTMSRQENSPDGMDWSPCPLSLKKPGKKYPVCTVDGKRCCTAYKWLYDICAVAKKAKTKQNRLFV